VVAVQSVSSQRAKPNRRTTAVVCRKKRATRGAIRGANFNAFVMRSYGSLLSDFSEAKISMPAADNNDDSPLLDTTAAPCDWLSVLSAASICAQKDPREGEEAQLQNLPNHTNSCVVAQMQRRVSVKERKMQKKRAKK
jgi:hypothetical protein